MKKFLLAALTLCLFLCVLVSPAMALGQQQTLFVPNTPPMMAQAPSGCQALQGQLAQVSHLLQYSRLYPGDGTYDPQIVKTHISTRATLLKQLSQVRTKLNACLISSAAVA